MNDDRKMVTLDDIQRRHNLNYIERIQSFHRQLVALASGGLTLLVSLSKNYIPSNPDCLVLIQGCWIALAVSVVCGLLVLFGEAQSYRDAERHIARQRNEFGDTATTRNIASGASGFHERRIFYYGRQVFIGSFLLAIVLLTWFAVLNAGGGK